jgi:hypothetical protein
MLIYDNICRKSADQTVALELNADKRLLVVGPLHHVSALDLPGIAVLWYGGLLSIHGNFEPDAALAAIEAEQLSAGNPLPAGATGEICLRGPKVTKGCWKELHLPFLASGFAAVMSAISTRTACSISPTAEGHDHLRGNIGFPKWSAIDPKRRAASCHSSIRPSISFAVAARITTRAEAANAMRR